MFGRPDDAVRFDAWLLDALRTLPAGYELHGVGPFQVAIPPDPADDCWVTLVDGNVAESDVRSSIPPLRKMFEHRHAELQIEFREELLPGAGQWLEDAGFKLVERNPLMACTTGFLKPFQAPDVALKQLETTSSDADLQAFQTMRWTEGNLAGHSVPPIDRLRRNLEAKGSVYLLAWLDGEPAGTGVSHRLKEAAEIVGIVTRADKRRRGVAATVSSNLVARHFDSGGNFAFLDAANDEAIRVYERLGFARFGANLVYR